jgi:hypothetical protein
VGRVTAESRDFEWERTMPKILRLSSFAAFPVLLLLGGCSDPQGPLSEEEQLLNLDVAQYVADATNDDVVAMTSEAEFAMRRGLHLVPGCRRWGFFKIRCVPRKFSGDGNLNITHEVTFYGPDVDQDGNLDPQEQYDSLTTEAINYVASIEGTRERTHDGVQFSVTVNRQRDFTVSGLTGEETQRTWNGTGSADVNRTRTSDEKGTRTYDMSSTTMVEDVVILVPRAGTYPQSGTITRHVTVEVVDGLADPTTRERDVVIEFDGTQFATITINGEVFKLDLETREVVKEGS